jgi:dipeptidyl-peptidase-3
MTLIVALHELLGHGTGKLFTKDATTGELNFDPAVVKNPFTGGEITTPYLSTETWS